VAGRGMGKVREHDCLEKTIAKLIDVIRSWISEKRTGSIQINFFKGGISNIKKEESVKLD